MKNKTDMTLILDKSGSMEIIRTDTIGGVNTFLKEQQATPGECDFSLVMFDTKYDFVYQGRPIKEVHGLSEKTYRPSGNTALLDAVGRSIHEAGNRLDKLAEADKPEKVIMVIITDGQENSSREYTKDQIKKMIEHQEKQYSWTFLYLGANQDAFAEAGRMGIRAAAVSNWKSDKDGAGVMYGAVGQTVREYRMKSDNSLHAFSADDQKKMMEGKK